MVHVRVVNLSVYGALIRTEGPSLVSGPIRIRLADAPETGWQEADVVRFEGSHEVGVRFACPCPPGFLSQAILGVDPRGFVRGDEETVDLGEMDSATWPRPVEN
jgi:hypothetical protein